MKAIEVKNLSYAQNGDCWLEETSFSVEEGEFLAIVGPNGSGKSTLIKLLAGLLTPTRGEINIFEKPAQKYSAIVGYMPQETGYNSDFPIRSIDVVKMGFLSSKIPAKEYDSRALEALNMVDAAHLKERRIGELSGGERQRVLIARAIAADNKILLLDEPTSNINRNSHIEDLFNKLKRRSTVVCVSHDREKAARVSDRIIRIERGQANNA
ncbi:MAG: ABC transporter ATP-binding protein [Helicobacteraceae bacterium]|jgi:zinc transport system ATP-binding protein|nr:ABC transporter ATP-binding protein [Helicobacteraceae bacterium]